MSALAEVKEAEPDAEPVLTPRQQLAAAIGRCSALKSQITANDAALEAASASIWEASAAAETARKLADEAPANVARHTIAARTGDRASAPMSVRDARAKAEETEEQLQSLRQARTDLEAQGERLRERLGHAEALRDTRIGELVGGHPSTRALLDRYKALQVEMISTATTIRLLSSKNFLGPKDRSWEATPIVRVQYDPGWFAALDGLQRDADTTLPLPD